MPPIGIYEAIINGFHKVEGKSGTNCIKEGMNCSSGAGTARLADVEAPFEVRHTAAAYRNPLVGAGETQHIGIVDP